MAAQVCNLCLSNDGCIPLMFRCSRGFLGATARRLQLGVERLCSREPLAAQARSPCLSSDVRVPLVFGCCRASLRAPPDHIRMQCSRCRRAFVALH
eukprot:scaffold187023_cov31-Tisochrysis_lutea.AAC.6